jgi:hypothetical protein
MSHVAIFRVITLKVSNMRSNREKLLRLGPPLRLEWPRKLVELLFKNMRLPQRETYFATWPQTHLVTRNGSTARPPASKQSRQFESQHRISLAGYPNARWILLCTDLRALLVPKAVGEFVRTPRTGLNYIVSDKVDFSALFIVNLDMLYRQRTFL